MGLPRWFSGKQSACQRRRLRRHGLDSWVREGNGNPLQYSCLENSMHRGAWRATIHGVTRVGHDWATEHTGMPNYMLEKWKHLFLVRLHVCMLSCLTLCNPMDCSMLGSSVHGIFQAGLLCLLLIRQILYHWAYWIISQVKRINLEVTLRNTFSGICGSCWHITGHVRFKKIWETLSNSLFTKNVYRSSPFS